MSDVIVDECAVEGCDKPATEWAYSGVRKARVKCCRKHAILVVDEEYKNKYGGHEYHANCPHCGTLFGV